MAGGETLSFDYTFDIPVEVAAVTATVSLPLSGT
jgi:hypothetical protein